MTFVRRFKRLKFGSDIGPFVDANVAVAVSDGFASSPARDADAPARPPFVRQFGGGRSGGLGRG